MQEIEISKGIKRIQFDSFDSWLNARHGIGGSDASAVLGLNPYKTNTELYLEKTGQRTAPDISDKDYVKYGHDAESKFIFRIREGSDGQPMFKLVEADGGLWKYEAVDAIKKYLTENLPGELLKVITIIG